MSAYMDTPHYRVNKFLSTVEAINGKRGRAAICAGVELRTDDLAAVIQASAHLFTSDARVVELEAAASPPKLLCLDHDYRPAAHSESGEAVVGRRCFKCGATESHADAIHEAFCVLSTIISSSRPPLGQNAMHEIHCTALSGLARLRLLREQNDASGVARQEGK